LERDYQTKLTALRKNYEETTTELNQRLAADTTQADAAGRENQAKIQQLNDKRRAWISRAHKSASKAAMAQIEALEGKRKYELQRKTLDNTRSRKEGHANNEAAYAEFQRNLAENRQSYVELEKEVASAFAGYSAFGKKLTEPGEVKGLDLAPDEYQLLAALQSLHEKTSADLSVFRRYIMPHLFRLFPMWLLCFFVVVIHGAVIPILHFFKIDAPSYGATIGSFIGFLGLLIGAYYYGQRITATLADGLALALEKSRRMHNASLEKAENRYKQESARIEKEYEDTTNWINSEWAKTRDECTAQREAAPLRLEEQAARLSRLNEQRFQARLDQIQWDNDQETSRLRGEMNTQLKQRAASRDATNTKFQAEYQAQWQILTSEWQERVLPIVNSIRADQEAAVNEFPDWASGLMDSWKPSEKFVRSTRFARLEVDLARFCDALPKSPRLALPDLHPVLPLLLNYPQEGSVLFETTDSGHDEVAGALNNIMLRLLAQSPPGRVSFTIFDPVKLGQNFAGFMHLADYAEHLINSRIWTQAVQLEQRLADLNDHIEKVIQMYLRNEYASIAEYNEQAGNIAEKYHFLVIADFPNNFTDIGVRRLLNIAASGAKCGVYLLIHWDRRQSLPPGMTVEDLRKTCVCITSGKNGFQVGTQFTRGTHLAFDIPPDPDASSLFLHKIGKASIDSNRVEVPFQQVAPKDVEIWTGDTTEELRVPIGRTGATKLQYLAIGKGTRQHALVAGKTGSGKSTLFHVIITNLALWHSPEHVEFYLVDFKKGVEFKCYAASRLPHARVVAIESDREFGLSVLQRVDAELRRRGDLFRKLGVQDLAGYKREGGKEPVPRSLLLIDEFQEFFVEDDQISQNAAVLLDRIVRQGRAFGIHVILGSQTLGGAYTLARATLGQMVIRIALQCNEADAYLIMDDTNPAPRLLSRPGEGIYNDSAGALAGNSPFQTVWLPDQVRDVQLQRARNQADLTPGLYPGPIVFEGNVPADIRENHELQKLLGAVSSQPPTAGRIWLGSPVSIKGPTEALFQRLSGNHLLMVGQRDEAVLAILSVGLITLSAQYPRGTARFILLDGAVPGSPEREYMDHVLQVIPREITHVRTAELEAVMNQLGEELKQRGESENPADLTPIFVFIHELQNYKKLRREDEYNFSSEGGANPSTRLNDLICEGASHGIHIIATCDTYNNVNRFLSRKAISEFEMRVLFQMSANDSASLCDNPKASQLGLHRALFYNEQEGYLEMFRPYALPGNEWIEEMAKKLA
jgi:hypothetical protein